ncbi:hypothetical protein [Tsukamurella sp. 1534]|uniref:hypothetical protein n=1 Tax=Tsukamurella sp. 1534 TaxID=1151061 RepID=UPI00031927CB|nr:hypothetical protein [Tsukamurella sp. 1534]
MLIVDSFGPGGTTLWAELHRDDDPADVAVLVQEACRVADRLDWLNAAIASDGVFHLVERRDDVVELRVDNALQEARQQAGALQRLLADIAKRRTVEAEEPEDDPLDDL